MCHSLVRLSRCAVMRDSVFMGQLFPSLVEINSENLQFSFSIKCNVCERNRVSHKNDIMQKSMIALSLLVMILVSCRKDKEILNDQLTGTWELTKTFGGWGGTTEYAAGNGNTLTFTNSTYTRHFKNTDLDFTVSGNYVVYTGKPCDMAAETTVINFDTTVPSSTNASEISIADGILTFNTTACIVDGGGSSYRKISN